MDNLTNEVTGGFIRDFRRGWLHQVIRDLLWIVGFNVTVYVFLEFMCGENAVTFSIDSIKIVLPIWMLSGWLIYRKPIIKLYENGFYFGTPKKNNPSYTPRFVYWSSIQGWSFNETGQHGAHFTGLRFSVADEIYEVKYAPRSLEDVFEKHIEDKRLTHLTYKV